MILMREAAGILLAAWLGVHTSLAGMDITAATKDTDDKLHKEKRTGFVVLPVAFYQPETLFGGGLGGLFSFRPKKQSGETKPSALNFYMIYTQMNQFNSRIQPDIYIHGNDYLFSGEMILKRFPTKFWGIGADAQEEEEEDYTPRTTILRLALQKKILPSKNLYAGIQYQFENYKIEKNEAGGLLDRETVTGSARGRISGLGFVLNWDTRDNIFYPTRGNYWQLSSFINSKFLGSDVSFNSLKLDIRFYRPLFRNHVLAFQGVFESASGSPPFRHYPKLGGNSLMRGYYSGRFMDRNLAAFQAEYRLPVFWRLGLVGFAGLGGVSDSLNNFRLNDLKYSVGFGIRFKILPRDGTNVRIDIAFGDNTSGLYFTALESF